MNNNNKEREIAHHVFNGSITMIGVCITVIALFRVMKTSFQTYADELLSMDTLIFITASLFAYTALKRNNNARLEKVADVLFYVGMFIMLAIGAVIVLET